MEDLINNHQCSTHHMLQQTQGSSSLSLVQITTTYPSAQVSGADSIKMREGFSMLGMNEMFPGSTQVKLIDCFCCIMFISTEIQKGEKNRIRVNHCEACISKQGGSSIIVTDRHMTCILYVSPSPKSFQCKLCPTVDSKDLIGHVNHSADFLNASINSHPKTYPTH